MTQDLAAEQLDQLELLPLERKMWSRALTRRAETISLVTPSECAQDSNHFDFFSSDHVLLGSTEVFFHPWIAQMQVGRETDGETARMKPNLTAPLGAWYRRCHLPQKGIVCCCAHSNSLELDVVHQISGVHRQR